MPIENTTVTINGGTTGDARCPRDKACPTHVVVPSGAAATSLSLYAKRPSGSYSSVYDLETNTALVSGVTIASDRMYVLKPAVAAQLRGFDLQLVVNNAETAKDYVVGWSEYV